MRSGTRILTNASRGEHVPLELSVSNIKLRDAKPNLPGIERRPGLKLHKQLPAFLGSMPSGGLFSSLHPQH